MNWNETFEIVKFTLALGVNSVFFLFSLWGLVAFFPHKNSRGDNAASWLILAIWLGFLGAGLNVFYWRVFGDIMTYSGYMTAGQLRYIGFYGDFLWKGVGALSIYLHFFARYKSIPFEEQKHWTPLLMGFYPDLSNWARRIMVRTTRITDQPNKEE